MHSSWRGGKGFGDGVEGIEASDRRPGHGYTVRESWLAGTTTLYSLLALFKVHLNFRIGPLVPFPVTQIPVDRLVLNRLPPHQRGSHYRETLKNLLQLRRLSCNSALFRCHCHLLVHEIPEEGTRRCPWIGRFCLPRLSVTPCEDRHRTQRHHCPSSSDVARFSFSAIPRPAGAASPTEAHLHDEDHEEQNFIYLLSFLGILPGWARCCYHCLGCASLPQLSPNQLVSFYHDPSRPPSRLQRHR